VRSCKSVSPVVVARNDLEKAQTSTTGPVEVEVLLIGKIDDLVVRNPLT
jgi:hypothetical protein